MRIYGYNTEHCIQKHQFRCVAHCFHLVISHISQPEYSDTFQGCRQDPRHSEERWVLVDNSEDSHLLTPVQVRFLGQTLNAACSES